MSDVKARLAEEFQARLAVWSDIQESMPYLYERAASYAKPMVLELGVRSGNSTSAFLAAAADTGGAVWSCDVNPPVVPDYWHGCGHWTFWQGDDMNLQPELRGWPLQFDVLFIDTSHALDHTLAELRRFVPLVAPGGVVLMHDTKLTDPGNPDARPYVAEALDLYCQERSTIVETGPETRPSVTLQRVSWTELGGVYGLGVIEAPNG